MTAKDYRMEEFRLVHDIIERMGTASLNQITNASGLEKLRLGRSLSKWVASGRLFRIAKDKYSVSPTEKDPITYKGKRAKLREQQKESAQLANVFNNMVRVRDVQI